VAVKGNRMKLFYYHSSFSPFFSFILWKAWPYKKK